jgi:AcrR family transcriptional regulator
VARSERGQATREHLVAVATRRFTEGGYDATSVEAVLHESGVSRGALYHHFSGKDALFAAALDAVQDRVDDQMIAATQDSSGPAEALRAGCLAWIRLAADPAVQQILLTDAPAVLGWQRWREMDERRTLGRVRSAMAAVAAAGLLRVEQVDFFAHALLAVMNEFAIMIARAEDRASTARAAETAVNELLARVLRLPS